MLHSNLHWGWHIKILDIHISSLNLYFPFLANNKKQKYEVHINTRNKIYILSLKFSFFGKETMDMLVLIYFGEPSICRSYIWSFVCSVQLKDLLIK